MQIYLCLSYIKASQLLSLHSGTQHVCAPDLTASNTTDGLIRAESRRGTVNNEDAVLQYAIGGAREKLLNANWSAGIGNDIPQRHHPPSSRS